MYVTTTIKGNYKLCHLYFSTKFYSFLVQMSNPTPHPNFLSHMSPQHNSKNDKKIKRLVRSRRERVVMTSLPQPLFCWSHSHFSLDLIAKVDNTALSNRHSGAEQWGHGSFSGFMKSAS